MKNTTEKFYVVKIVLICFLLTIPFLGKEMGLDSLFQLNENRNSAQAPKLVFSHLTTFSTDFVKYFNDTFGFRNLLIKLNHTIKIEYLKSSPRTDVTFGKNDWLFFTPDVDPSQYANLAPYTPTELEQVKKNFQKMNDYFAKQNAKFYIMIAPASQTIYPEYLPQNYQSIYAHTKLAQLTDYLDTNGPEIKFINPTADLLAAKKDMQLYYKYDLHWNSYGAFIAYQRLMKTLHQDFPDLTAKKITDYTLSFRQSHQKDLENLIGMSGTYHENEPVLTPKFTQTFQNVSPDCPDMYNRCQWLITTDTDKSLPKLVMYRDSYASWLFPYLSNHFSKATYYWGPTPFPTDIVKKEKPDIVIFEVTERNMWTMTQDLFLY